jgi:predicted TIM-barrel fold metal-dependent hydrolase
MTQAYNLVDADAHVLEPGDLWFKYIDPKFRDVAPGMIVQNDGRETFRVEDGNVVDLGSQLPTGFAAVGGIGMREGNKPKGTSYYDGKPGGFDPHKRIPDMDAEGIDAAFLYPSLGLYLGGITNQKVAAASCHAYNRWLKDYCSDYPDRLFGVGIISLTSVEDAVAEIKFASKELGLRAGFVRPNPAPRPLHHPDNDPVWQAAQDHNFAIAIHTANSAVGMPVLGSDRFVNAGLGGGYAVKHVTSHTLEMMAAVTSFTMCGVCDRFPKLRVGFMEAGGGWVAGWLDRMDRHVDDKSMNDTGLSMRPSELFRRQCFISFEPVEGTLPLLADYLGRETILWATDYPHSDGYTDAPGMIRKIKGMTPDLVKTIMSTGAKRFYDLH